MSGMDDLVTWLRAQLDEDERVAREALAWRDDRMTDHEYAWSLTSRLNGRPKRHHVIPGAPTPARVLAEVAAKRRLLQQFELRAAAVRGIDGVQTGGVWDDMLRLLALPYADGPGYREEWRP